MARPTTIDDVDDYLKAPHAFVKVDLQFLTRDTRVGAAILNLINKARGSEQFIVSDDGEFTVSVPRSEEELNGALLNAQRTWDYGEEMHEKVASGDQIEKWQRATVDRWLKAEGLPPIDWDVLDAEAVLS